jgi:hypothetical protein
LSVRVVSAAWAIRQAGVFDHGAMRPLRKELNLKRHRKAILA